MELVKAYIYDSKRREKPEQAIVDFGFTSVAQKAETWPTKLDADSECAVLEAHPIEIPLQDGGKYVCKGFRSESIGGVFAITCKVPPPSLQAARGLAQ